MPNRPKSFKNRILLYFLLLTLAPFAIFFTLILGVNVGTQRLIKESSTTIRDLIVNDSQRLLLSLNEEMVYQKAKDVAKQVELFVKAHPRLTRTQLINNEEFKKISPQAVGKTGYTAVFEGNTGVVLAHPNPAIVGNRNLAKLGKELPEWWAIFSKGTRHEEGSGYYKWKEVNGDIKLKYMVTVPVEGYDYSVAATTYVEELTQPQLVVADKAVAATEKIYLTLKEVYRNYLALLVACFLVILCLVFIADVKISSLISKPVFKIRDIAKSISGGNLRMPISGGEYAEIGAIYSSLKKVINKFNDYQSELRKKDALACIGQSTAMIAHDVRKPLTVMKALLQSLPAVRDNPEKLKEMMANVDVSIVRTNAMLNEILDFSRDATALEIREQDPQSIITSAVGDALRNHPGSGVRFEYAFNHLHTLHVDDNRIIRVLTNIIDNALDAMTVGQEEKAYGFIKIGTYEVERDEKPFIGIIITDNGPGIPEDIIDKIFDPFFTQGKKGGTGLGLAICQMVINMHGGRLSVANDEKTKGARFTIELPSGKGRVGINEDELILDSKELKPFREEEAVRVEYGDTANTQEFMRLNKERGRKSYLLIIDDEPLFRETIRSLLGGLEQVRDHVKVVETGSAEEALKLFEARQFDYVIADIDLGRRRMNGYELAQVILEKHPDTHVLIHSNKRKEELDKNVRQVASDKFMGFLPKPMRSSELLQFLACKTFEISPQAGKSAGQRARKTILVVNDDDTLLFTFRDMLRSPGIQVLDATNVGDALTHFANNRIDAIVSDVNLGEGMPDGYDFLKEVRKRDSSIPFLFTSGYSKADVWPEAEKLGASGYLQLPLEKEELKELVGI